MKVYEIHPIRHDGGLPIHKVTTKSKRRGKEVDVHVAWFDPPGTYSEDEWNVHYDGCDYACKSIEECKQKLDELDGYEFDASSYSYIRVETKFVTL